MHPAPARLARRGCLGPKPHWNQANQGNQARLPAHTSPSVQRSKSQSSPVHCCPSVAVPAVVCHQRLSVSRQRPKVTNHKHMHRRDASSTAGRVPLSCTHQCRRCRPQTYTRATKTARQQLDHSRWEEWGDVRRLPLRGVAGPEPARGSTPLYINYAIAKYMWLRYRDAPPSRISCPTVRPNHAAHVDWSARRRERNVERLRQRKSTICSQIGERGNDKYG